MNRNKHENNGFYGHLPEAAPLANPYVPFQSENSPKYAADTAIIKGTLFPGLELPFMDMSNKNELPVTPLTQLQTLSFAIQELALYLDTHREDVEALDLYRSYQKMYNENLMTYEKMCGPINHMSLSEGTYQWLDEPWPWEYAKNREV